MTARVTVSASGRLATGWCSDCLEAYGGGPVIVRNWAYVHNEINHPSEAVPTGAASTITTEET